MFKILFSIFLFLAIIILLMVGISAALASQKILLSKIFPTENDAKEIHTYLSIIAGISIVLSVISLIILFFHWYKHQMAINNGRILLFISIINLLVSVIITYLGKLSSNKIENLNYKLDDINLNLTVSYSGGYVAIILFLFSIITFYLSRYTDKEDNISSSSSDGDNVSINSLSSYGDNVSINSLSDGDDLSIQSRVSDFSDMSVSSDEHGINTTHSGTPTGTLSATITSPSTGTLSATTNSSIPNLSISVYNSRGEDTSMTYIYKETNNWYDPEKNMEMYINSENMKFYTTSVADTILPVIDCIQYFTQFNLNLWIWKLS